MEIISTCESSTDTEVEMPTSCSIGSLPSLLPLDQLDAKYWLIAFPYILAKHTLYSDLHFSGANHFLPSESTCVACVYINITIPDLTRQTSDTQGKVHID